MHKKYYTADVFTRELFSGAQIAVFPNAGNLSQSKMQQIAQELNLSETAFILSPDQSNHTRRIRIFSPTREIDFAGHVILAVGYILVETGEIALSEKENQLVFELNRQLITAHAILDDGKLNSVDFSVCVNPIVDRFVPPVDELADIIGLSVSDIETKPLMPRMVSTGYPYLIIPVKSYAAVRKAVFNFNLWSASLAPSTAAQEILLVTSHTNQPTIDFHTRLIGAGIGLHEDPPVGAAMPAFAAYLSSHEHVRPGRYAYSVERGTVDTRQSLLNVEMDHQGSDELLVRLGGQAVLVTEGIMNIG
ncbi:MAG: PhzF family phenazine biosynthesis protein [Gammaproteobacteria bacterium]|nr:PhzF family phenazine biosynthesis protein [Gammaproteobacteria bacterium]